MHSSTVQKYRPKILTFSGTECRSNNQEQKIMSAIIDIDAFKADKNRNQKGLDSYFG